MPAVAMERELGAPLHFIPARRPQRSGLRGQHVLLRPVVADDDAEPLFAESHPPLADPGLWTYMPGGPYADVADLRAALVGMGRSEDPLFLTLAELPGEHPAGIASYLRITPEHGVIEIGYIWFGATLQRTTAASEAIYLWLPTRSTSSDTGGSSGSATRSTRPHAVPPRGSAFGLRECSATTW